MATPVMAFASIANECEAEGLSPKNGERIGHELAKVFSVHPEEVAILRVSGQNLGFVYPARLAQVGSIPLNTSNSVAARTATTKRPEVVNNFAQAKHASVFEAVELGDKPKPAPGQKMEKHMHVIQKLMSVPVTGAAGVLGVIQVSRKGESAPAAGPDFTPMDMQKLTAIASALAKCFK
ncbi:MAG TPA: GAF domain-containing protein [Terriglobales bacterium]|nr:GAF domain-containing protein [Terriglobales bacterium]